MSDHQFQEREFESDAGVDLLDLLMGGQAGPPSRRQEIQELLGSFPRLSEADLIKLGHGDNDTTCPICITPLPAILAEEEMAVAMESPAHPFEELGVTRLWIESREEGQRGCGHLFCRRCISKWIAGGHDSCPTCRYLIVPRPTGADSSAATVAEVDDALRQLQSHMRIQRRIQRALFGGADPRPIPDEVGYNDRDRQRAMRDLLPAEVLDGFGVEEGGRRQRDEDDRSEYLGMYS